MSTSVSVVIALFCVTGFQLTYSVGVPVAQWFSLSVYCNGRFVDVGVEDEIVQYPLGRCQCQSQ